MILATELTTDETVFEALFDTPTTPCVGSDGCMSCILIDAIFEVAEETDGAAN